MDYCVICGEYVPEGSMVCKKCWIKIMGRGRNGRFSRKFR